MPKKTTTVVSSSGRKIKVVIKPTTPTLLQGAGTAMTVNKQVKTQQKKKKSRFSSSGGIRG